jgi:hypothetical protein
MIWCKIGLYMHIDPLFCTKESSNPFGREILRPILRQAILVNILSQNHRKINNSGIWRTK